MEAGCQCVEEELGLACPRSRELPGQRLGELRAWQAGPRLLSAHTVPGAGGGPLPSGSDSIFPPLLPYLSRDLMSPSSTEKRERQRQI